eukprot:g18627.t1
MPSLRLPVVPGQPLPEELRPETSEQVKQKGTANKDGEPMNNDHDQPFSLLWNNFSYTVADDKRILHSVYGEIRSGEVTALMGFSGAGKSTLMNLLAARQAWKGLSAEAVVTLGGNVVSENELRASIGFLPQDDGLFPFHTVEEALMFRARLTPRRLFLGEKRRKGSACLSKKLASVRLNLDLENGSEYAAADEEEEEDACSDAGVKEQLLEKAESDTMHNADGTKSKPGHQHQKKKDAVAERVYEVMRRLGLYHVKDTIIGNSQLRGVSGGERKRVAVACELLSGPPILFLDEPTSGLDSLASTELIRYLKQLAREENRLILCTIHQPSSFVFSLFDQAIVMKKGEILLEGAVGTAVYGGCGHEGPTAGGSSVGNVGVELADYAAAVGFLFLREFCAFKRNKSATMSRFGTLAFFIVLYSALFFRIGMDLSDTESLKSELSLLPNKIRGEAGALQSMLITLNFQAAAGYMQELVNSRDWFLREHGARLYRPSAFVGAKLLMEICIQLLSVLLFNVTLYFAFGLHGNFLVLTAAGFALVSASASIALFCSSLVKSAQVATILQPLVFVPQIYLSGQVVPIARIHPAIRWLRYLMPLAFATDAAMVDNFAPLETFAAEWVSEAERELAALPATGGGGGAEEAQARGVLQKAKAFQEGVARGLGVEVRLGSVAGEHWLLLNLGVLAALFVVFRGLAIAGLHVNGRYLS